MENRAQFLKGVARTLVLGLLRERPMYGYEMATALAARSEGVFALGQGTLYPVLYSLEKKGLIRVSREEEARIAGIAHPLPESERFVRKLSKYACPAAGVLALAFSAGMDP